MILVRREIRAEYGSDLLNEQLSERSLDVDVDGELAVFINIIVNQ